MSMQPYVHACANGRWTVEVWRRDGSDPTRRRFVYRCNSWRHEGECRLKCGACDFVRMREAIEKGGPWVYMVLTYPRPRAGGQRAIFKAGVQHWYSLRKRMENYYGPMRYLQTWEVTQAGTPHVNVLVECETLHTHLGWNHRKVKTTVLEPMIVRSGFGSISYCEAMKSATRMAGYLTKLARELTGAGVKCQVPVNAPRHFRRIRASIGLLPPRRKDHELTGRLIRHECPPSPSTGLWGEWAVE